MLCYLMASHCNSMAFNLLIPSFMIELLLCRNLLYLACQHHILQLIAAAAIKKVLPLSSSPNIQLFKRFKDNWEFIDQAKYEDASTDEVAASGVEDIQEKLIKFIEGVLTTETQPRDDYRELMELTLLFLGRSPTRGTRFRVPGANHHAWWMAKVIYTFKVWMLRSQFRFTSHK